MENIDKCPFCESASELVVSSSGTCFVECKSCKARGSVFGIDYKNNAITNWNTRIGMVVVENNLNKQFIQQIKKILEDSDIVNNELVLKLESIGIDAGGYNAKYRLKKLITYFEELADKYNK